MMHSFNRRLLLGGAVAGAAGSAVGVAAAAPAPVAASAARSPLPPNLFGPEPGTAHLSRNENPYGPAPSVIAAVEEATKLGAYYCDTDVLAAMIAERNGVRPEQVVLSTGSGEGLSAAALAFGKDGAILCPSLFWDTTARYAEAKGVTLKRVPLKTDWSIDLDAMAAAADDAVGLVQICNPNNPTGMMLEPAALKAFCRKVGPKAPVLVDEAYNELTDAPEANSVMDLVRAGENVIVARTFSKIYGMAGMRIGYMIASPQNAQRIRGYVMSWMSAPSVAAAVASYNDERFLAYSKAKVIEGRQMVLDGVKRVGLTALPSQTNFVYVRVPDAATFQRRMREKGVVIRGPYGSLTQWSRVSMGKLEDVERYVKALPEVLRA